MATATFAGPRLSSLDARLNELAARIQGALAADATLILRMDAAEGVLIPWGAHGLDITDVAEGVRVPLGKGFAGRVAIDGRVRLLDDVPRDELLNWVLGRDRTWSLLGAPLIADERLLGVVLVGTVQRRRFTERDAELLRWVAELAALAIANSQPDHAAHESLREREEFLTIAAHELKTPLTTIKGYVQLLSRQLRGPAAIPSTASDLVDQLQGEVERLEDLTSDILDASRLRQGQRKLHRRWIDLADFARRVLARFEGAPERTPHHDLALEATATVGGYWDPGYLDQVLTNLVSNALKYSPGGGTVRLRIEGTDQHAVLVVADKGIGMTREDQMRLFQPFERSAAARRAAEGTGLGLYITKQLVEQHGGTIAVESEYGVGTSVTVTLPLHPPAMSDA